MALFKIARGPSNALGTLPTKATEGFAYFQPYNGSFYIDIKTANTAVVANSTQENSSASRIKIAAGIADKVGHTLTLNNKTFNGASDVDIGTIGVGYGGTGKTSWTQYGVIYASASNALGQITAAAGGAILVTGNSKAPTWLAAGTSGYILKSIGTTGAPTWINPETDLTAYKTSKTLYFYAADASGAAAPSGTNNITFNGSADKSISTKTINALNKAGGTMTGTLYFANGTTYYINDSGTAYFNGLTTIGSFSLSSRLYSDEINAVSGDTTTITNENFATYFTQNSLHETYPWSYDTTNNYWASTGVTQDVHNINNIVMTEWVAKSNFALVVDSTVNAQYYYDYVEILVNGTQKFTTKSSSNSTGVLSAHGIVYLKTNDIVQFRLKKNSSSNPTGEYYRMNLSHQAYSNTAITKASASILPSSNNSYSLGNDSMHWSKLYLGANNSYGSTSLPIYWDNGLPKAITSLIVGGEFSLGSATIGKIASGADYSLSGSPTTLTDQNFATYFTQNSLDATYPWSYDTTNSYWANMGTTQGVHNVNNVVMTEWKALSDFALTVAATVNAETGYDYFEVLVNGTSKLTTKSSGTKVYSVNGTLYLKTNDIIQFRYKKDGSGEANPEYYRAVLSTQSYTSVPTIQITKDMAPTSNNSFALGSVLNRWSKLYLGSANSYGSSSQPIWWNNGVPQACGAIGITSGGTGLSSLTPNRIYYASDSTTLTNAHYIDGTSIGVNMTSAPSVKFAVNGTFNLGTDNEGRIYSDIINTLTGTPVVITDENLATYFTQNSVHSTYPWSYDTTNSYWKSAGTTQDIHSINVIMAEWVAKSNFAFIINASIRAEYGCDYLEILVNGTSQFTTKGASSGTKNGTIYVKTNDVVRFRLYKDGSANPTDEYYRATLQYQTYSSVGAVGVMKNLLPSSTNSFSLGASNRRWSKLYIGTADSYGSANQPIWWNAGTPQACSSVGVAYGGTGLTSFTANRIYYPSSTTALSGAHYIDNTSIGINTTSAPGFNLGVSGTFSLGTDSLGKIATGNDYTLSGSPTVITNDNFTTYFTQNSVHGTYPWQYDTTNSCWANMGTTQGIHSVSAAVMAEWVAKSAFALVVEATVNAEHNYDYFEILVNNVQKFTTKGGSGTGVYTVNGAVYLAANDVVKFRYTKDGSGEATGEYYRAILKRQSFSSVGLVQITKDLIPTTNNSYALGTALKHWSKLYIGSADSYGSTSQPIYWNAGVPAGISAVDVGHGGTGATSFTANSIIISGSTTTSALTTRAITNNTSNTAITNNTNIPTMNTIYYGLVTVNGSAQTRATGIYAPTSAGTNGQFLKSTGSGAPSWSALPTASSSTAGIMTLGASGGAATYAHTHTTAVEKVTSGTSAVTLEYSAKYKITAGGTTTIFTMPGGSAITLNGASTTSASFYAPTSAGTSGYYLKSNGSGAPTWTSFPTIPTIKLNNSTTTSATFWAPTSGGTSGQYLKSNGTSAPTWASITTATTIATTTSQFYLVGHTSSTGSTSRLYCRTTTYIDTSGYLHSSRVYNAVWNDYAEYRQADSLEPGRCVTEQSTSIMTKTTKRLMPGCKIISDTYGNCMGKTNKAKTPIAVAGRVLAYPYQPRENYTLGAAVCSAPNGTVDIMTRDEIMMYPERIVGTVSEIPTYNTWGEENISVNGRIWIYIK